MISALDSRSECEFSARPRYYVVLSSARCMGTGEFNVQGQGIPAAHLGWRLNTPVGLILKKPGSSIRLHFPVHLLTDCKGKKV